MTITLNVLVNISQEVGSFDLTVNTKSSSSIVDSGIVALTVIVRKLTS